MTPPGHATASSHSTPLKPTSHSHACENRRSAVRVRLPRRAVAVCSLAASSGHVQKRGGRGASRQLLHERVKRIDKTSDKIAIN
eukprot:131612-Prorocentrum_minimum.AAC.2